MYVLPVAVWILQSGKQGVGPSDAMAGLGGRCDRQRVIEALAKLTEIGAMVELPRAGHRNAPRYFERVKSPYWGFAEAFAAEIGVQARTEP